MAKMSSPERAVTAREQLKSSSVVFVRSRPLLYLKCLFWPDKINCNSHVDPNSVKCLCMEFSIELGFSAGNFVILSLITLVLWLAFFEKQEGSFSFPDNEILIQETYNGFCN